ncbi:MAG: cobyrinate a,c-diamide synthase [Eggerthellaceae bacterium]|nr:cobyrinate a,c-diamide synthase [Eggerthellaceae bacterium]
MLDIPRILICAPSSGSGKTTITCGILQLLADRSLDPAAFKCGPDYIDPQFHRRVVGVRSGNLDTFFTDDAVTRSLLARGAQGCGIAVLESAMGYYDGVAGIEARGSGYDVARATRTPAILVVDARGASLSLAATVSGFVRFASPSHIAGVILNRCSKGVYDRLKDAIAERAGVPVVGYVPRDDRFGLQSRHLGLVGAAEVDDLRGWLKGVADALSQTIDVDALLDIACSAPALECEPYRTEAVCDGVRLAVALDEAFNFYYAENLRMLEDLGARLVFFSPLSDGHLPEGVDGLYLGGGYPELHARELSENAALQNEIRAAVEGGLPTVAECGGFLYLQRELEDPSGVPWRMVGALPGHASNLGKLRQFGFVEIRAQRDCLCCDAGDSIRAHEFHYWHSDAQGDAFVASKPSSPKQWPCIVATESLMAGFPHAYYPANPSFARRFVEAMARRRQCDGS